MPQPLPERLQRTLARVAEHIQAERTEYDEQRRRLGTADVAELRRVLADRAESSPARRTALMILVSQLRRERALSDDLLPLIDDPDAELAQDAIRYAPPFDPRVTGRLHALLDDPRETHWSLAAETLARRKDRAILPRLADWFHNGDTPHRNVAFGCLRWLLEPEDYLAMLGRAWEAGGRGDEDRANLAAGLLGLGDDRGVPFLEALARRAEGHLSAYAADAIYDHDQTLGLELMAGLLGRAPAEVAWGMAERIAKRADHRHLGTADALAEARDWVEQRRAGAI